MNGLLDVATVLTGDGHWSATSYGVDSLACGRRFTRTDVCTPADLQAPDVNVDRGYEVEPFAVLADQTVPARCAPGDVEFELGSAMRQASEYQVAQNFWSGGAVNWTGDLFITSTTVDSVAAGATVQDTMAALLRHFYDKNPDAIPIVHLGFLSALKLSPSKLDELDITYVISQGYPNDALAVTGPIIVHLGTIETLSIVDTSDNRKHITATRMAAVEFDPCLAVRAS